MYNLPYHKERDAQVINAFIEDNPFAFITGCNANNEPIATQLPLFLENIDGKQVLRGHLMKNTDHHKAFLHNPKVLVVFSGKHTYVSGTWYSNPHSPSTWNYMSAHVKGKIKFVNEGELKEMLRKTSLHFEGQDEQSPTVFDNLPESFTKKMLKLIVSFEIEVTEIDTVFKLSQDRDQESYENIIKKLNEQDESGRAIAQEMEKRKQTLFSKS
jgi:transcriptional regulator